MGSVMKVRVNCHGYNMPEKHGDWIDLSTAEDADLEAMELKTISLGVSMELPEGYEAHMLPRSSTFKKWGIIMANSMGIIDNAYCGDKDVWGFQALAIRKTHIPKGTRIAQFRIVKVCETVSFEMVDSLGNEDRGGFGSTGV